MIQPIEIDLFSSENRALRVKYVREHLLKLSRPEFCERVDINIQSLKAWELVWGGGLTEKGAEKIVKGVKKLSIYCTVAWLMYGVGSNASYFSDSLDLKEEEDNQIVKELLVFRDQPNAINAVITDDSMIPSFYPGTHVGGLVVHNANNAIDRECIVVTKSNEVFVRILKHGADINKYNVSCINKSTASSKIEISNIALKIIAPIVWIRKRKPQELE